ncbi:MAG: hypothetical protein AB1742_07610, partial [bacterium]
MRKILLPVLICLLPLALSTAHGAESPVVNMILPDGRLLIYAGKNQGVRTGASFEVRRGNKLIARIEITEALDHYSYAKVLEKSEEIMEMDVLAAAPQAKKEEKKKEK